MKPIIAVRTRGKRRRPKPLSRSGTRVVAARITEAAAPSVALATMFQAAHRPSRDRDSPITSRRSPRPMKGRNTANSRKGSLDEEAAEQEAGGRRPAAAAAATRAAWAPKAQKASRGVATTAITNSSVAASFTSGRRRCSGPSAWR